MNRIPQHLRDDVESASMEELEAAAAIWDKVHSDIRLGALEIDPQEE